MQPALPTIHFISFDKPWVDAITTLFSGCTNVTVTHGNIKSLPVKNTVFVSPANSLGFMDGDIDWVLSREMFPGIQSNVQLTIHFKGLVNGFGRRYLPVGSAFCMRVRSMSNSHLIVAPTMFQPRDVSHTRNAYWSFLAALTVFAKHMAAEDTEMTLVATSHCCGYGCMDPVESATQMHTAYMDFCAGVGTRLDTQPADVTSHVRFLPSDIDDGSNGHSRVDEDNEVKEICIRTS